MTNPGTATMLKITKVDGPSEKGWFTAFTQDGKKYGTKNASINNFIGLEAQFMVNSVNKNGRWSNYINDPFPSVPSYAQGNSNGSEKKQFNTDSMYVAYAKDLVIARMQLAQQQDISNSALVRDVLDIADGLINGRKAAEDDVEVPF